MQQVFIFGASSVYGVGSEAGWGDLVKSYAHAKMYGPNGSGETGEVFNFAKSGATIEWIAETAAWAYEKYSRGGEIVTMLSAGGNDAKAKDVPGNFVCSPEEFEEKIDRLLELAQQHSQRVIFVSNGFVDETKTNPKPNPFGSGSLSYFSNQRRALFNSIAKQICERRGIDFIAVDIDETTWIANYLFADGLHPNQAGYQKIFEMIQPAIDTCLNEPALLAAR